MSSVCNTREILKDLVRELSTYNGSDMLEGYLNTLAIQFNERLEQVGIAEEIEYFNKYPIEVEYSLDEDRVDVYHPASDEYILTIRRASYKIEEHVLYNQLKLLHWIEENYEAELDNMNF